MDSVVAGLIGAFGGAFLGVAGASRVSFVDRQARQEDDRRARVEQAAASLTGAALNLHGLVPVAQRVRDFPRLGQLLGGPILTGNLLAIIGGTMERAAVAHSILRTSAPESVIAPADALLDTMETATSAMAEGDARDLDFTTLTDRVAELRAAVRSLNGYSECSASALASRPD